MAEVSALGPLTCKRTELLSRSARMAAQAVGPSSSSGLPVGLAFLEIGSMWAAPNRDARPRETDSNKCPNGFLEAARVESETGRDVGRVKDAANLGRVD